MRRFGFRGQALALATACAALLPPAAVGQGASGGSLYTCRDHTGHALTSDRPILDCAGTMRELSPSGVVRREIAPPMSAEQVRQKEADDRARRLADESAREQRRRDSALLAAYQNEDQIEAARRRSLVDTNDSLRSSQARLVELQNEQRALAQENDGYGGKAPLFRRKLEDNQAAVADELAAIRQRQADVERVNQRYDEEKRRYRELTKK